jgi:hypothetical protein
MADNTEKLIKQYICGSEIKTLFLSIIGLACFTISTAAFSAENELMSGIANLNEYKLIPTSDKNKTPGYVQLKSPIYPDNGSQSDPYTAAGDSFGFSISAEGRTVVVGASNDTENNINSGSVYIYKSIDNNWSLVQKLLPSTATDGQLFGYEVSLSGGKLAVSALGNSRPGDNVSRGAIFMFENLNDNWVETDIVYDTKPFGIGFGKTLKLVDQTTLLIGDDYTDNTKENDGAVYLYRLTEGNWQMDHKFKSADAGDNFGFSADMENDLVLVGTQVQNEAFIFEKINNQWQQTQKLTPADLGTFDEFGRKVAIHNQQLFISSRRHDNEKGAVYVFEKDAKGVWIQIQKLVPLDGTFTDYFGWGLAVSGNRLLIGSPSSAGTNQSETGNAYLFEKINNSWLEVQKISASDAEFNDLFGRFVTISGPLYMIGATGDDDAGIDAGSAYIFDSTVDMIFAEGFE